MAIDKEAIKEHVRGILIALGDDPDREGLVETPDRVARMYEEVFEGVLGLSKIARSADMGAKRLQLQERIGSDIAYVISKAAGTEDVAVMIEAHHSCMTARGIKKPGSKTMTTTLRGRFESDTALQNKLLMMYNAGR